MTLRIGIIYAHNNPKMLEEKGGEGWKAKVVKQPGLREFDNLKGLN